MPRLSLPRELVIAFLNGHSLRTVAEKWDLPLQQVAYALKKLGFQRRHMPASCYPTYRSTRNLRIVQLAKKGWRVSEIALLMGLTSERTGQILRIEDVRRRQLGMRVDRFSLPLLENSTDGP